MVELIVADFFDYTFLGVVIVAIAIGLGWSKAKSQVDGPDYVVGD
jgi:hypothetical protein